VAVLGWVGWLGCVGLGWIGKVCCARECFVVVGAYSMIALVGFIAPTGPKVGLWPFMGQPIVAISMSIFTFHLRLLEFFIAQI
jgi:hypothetical protein